MGWLKYIYRKKVAVNATAAGAQTNYQMQLLVGESAGAVGEDVHCEGNCVDFPNDIRFTGADGTTQHDYWVQTTTGTTPNRLATIWIEVASIPASSSVDFYMYYGMADDSGESSGDSTFVDYNMSGIVALWHMDEASWDGTPDEVEDETGSNDGVAIGGLDTIAGGKFNRCGDYDGIDDYINLTTHVGSFTGLNQGSILGWVYHEENESQTPFWLADNSLKDYFVGVYIASDTNKLHYFNRGSGHNDSWITDAAISAGWHQIVVTCDGSTTKVYIDGSLATGTWYFGSDHGYWFNDVSGLDRAYIGVGEGLTQGVKAAFTKGQIDEVQIFNRALTQAEVTAINNNYLEKMGSYYNIRKWASPAPTWGTWGGQSEQAAVGTRCYAFIIS